jgi:hypothetical protein
LSGSPKPPSTLVFFVERSLGNTVGLLLRAAGWNVVLHRERFAHDAPDTEWLKVAGKEQWVVLNKDKAIRYNPLELRAFKDGLLRGVFLARGNLRSDEMAAAFLSALTHILRAISVEKAPYIVKINRQGAVTTTIRL